MQPAETNTRLEKRQVSRKKRTGTESPSAKRQGIDASARIGETEVVIYDS